MRKFLQFTEILPQRLRTTTKLQLNPAKMIGSNLCLKTRKLKIIVGIPVLRTQMALLTKIISGYLQGIKDFEVQVHIP